MYEKQVFFIENLGHSQPTEARKIWFEEALRFEEIHRAVYLAHHVELINIRNQPVPDRTQVILDLIKKRN